MASEHFQTSFTHCSQILGQTHWQRGSLSVSRWAFIFAIWCILNIIFPLFCVPSCYIHMTFFFFQGPNSSFLICTYIHAHPHTHSLIDTLTDHTHSHVTHTHHAHTHTHTHTLKYSLPPCIITQTLHTHTHPPDTHHTHIHSHRHTQQATTDTYHTQVFEHPARHWGYNSE